jgi:hypothetical protein
MHAMVIRHFAERRKLAIRGGAGIFDGVGPPP